MTRALWVMEPTVPALVLGSTQDPASVDAARAETLGVEVVRRRSGGGAVLVEPGRVGWVDVLVPAGDARWDDDVGHSFHWVGDTWVRALAAIGIEAACHRGPLVATEWSRQVCFAGLGPGEVTAGHRKIVGLSQRRTRAGARIQCLVLADWDPTALARLLGLPGADLSDVAAGVGADHLEEVVEAFVAVVTQ
jgi:lipoate-protein ligase A